MKVVVGLGNPGPKYDQTRHNVGYAVADELARRHGGGKPRSDFDGDVVDIFLAEEKTLLLAPTTYMNLSGRSVRRIVDYFDLPMEDLLVVCDDMNLETGRLRLRSSGSAGGQKGLNDIIHRLGTDQVPRLRIGIGRPPGRMDSADYVLGRFRGSEVDSIEQALLKAADAVETWVREGIEAAMNRFNPAEAG